MVIYKKGVKCPQRKSSASFKKGHISWCKGLIGCHEGEKNPMYGRTQKKETREKISKDHKERYKDKRNHPMYGKKNQKRSEMNRSRKGNFPLEIVNKISKANKGRHFSLETEFKRGDVSWSKGLTKETDERVRKNSEKLKGIPKSKEHRKKLSESKKELWKNKEFREKTIKAILKGLLKRPTSFEQKISDLCLKYHLPFIYSGDGRFLVGYKNPDFKHKCLPILIEVYNDYHHPKDYEEVRGKHFKKYGYKTIFINQQEVTDKNWETICLNKINTSV